MSSQVKRGGKRRGICIVPDEKTALYAWGKSTPAELLSLYKPADAIAKEVSRVVIAFRPYETVNFSVIPRRSPAYMLCKSGITCQYHKISLQCGHELFR